MMDEKDFVEMFVIYQNDFCQIDFYIDHKICDVSFFSKENTFLDVSNARQ